MLAPGCSMIIILVIFKEWLTLPNKKQPSMPIGSQGVFCCHTKW